MNDILRLLLLLGAAGSAMTLLGSGAAYLLDEERRMRRMLRRALGGTPEMVITARGRGLGAGLNLDRQQIAVLWNGGLKGLVYRLDQLMGAELIVDEQVQARAFRGENRRPLDHTPSGAGQVVLRLVFDNPRDPEFELPLWPPADPQRREQGTALEAIQFGRRWVAAAESMLRQPPARVAAAEPDVEEDD